jgi:hypothetical protein
MPTTTFHLTIAALFGLVAAGQAPSAIQRGTLNQLEQAQRLLTDLDPADFPKSQ